MKILRAIIIVMLLPSTAFAVEAAGTETDAQVRARAQRDAEQIAQQLLKVQDTAPELECAKAVENARYGVETMLEVGEKNVKGGYMKPEQFASAAAPLRALLPQLTVADCEAAKDNKRAFYQCMSSDYNHVMACAQAHPY